MKKEDMIFTQNVSITMTFDKIVTTITKVLETVDANGVRSLKGYSCVRTVEDIVIKPSEQTEHRKAA